MQGLAPIPPSTAMAERWNDKDMPQQQLKSFMHILHKFNLGHRLAGSRQFLAQIRAPGAIKDVASLRVPHVFWYCPLPLHGE